MDNVIKVKVGSINNRNTNTNKNVIHEAIIFISGIIVEVTQLFAFLVIAEITSLLFFCMKSAYD